MSVFKPYILKIFLLLIVASIAANECNAQYTLDWANTYGGDARDEAFSIVENHNGDLILAGYTKKEEKHLWVISIDEFGKPLWGKTFKAKPISEARSIIITKDSSLVVAGYSVREFLTQRDLWVLKLDMEGKLKWDKNYGGDGDESAYAMVETYDAGYAIAGFSSTNDDYQDDAWILKLDSAGDKEWERFYGGSKKDYAYDIVQTTDHGLVFCGYQSKRAGAYMSFWVAKVDSAGNDIWDYVVPFHKWDVATSVVEGLDGFIYVAGYTRSTSVIDYDIAIAKLDQEGNIIWQKTISWGRWDQTTSMATTYDNGIVISGFTRSGKEMSSDFAVTKIDENGNVLWQNIFARKSLDYPNSITETRDNGLGIAGTTYMQGRGWDFALLKFKNDNQPTIYFMQDSVATSTSSEYSLTSCINSKSSFRNVQIFFNDSLFIDNANKDKVIDTKDNDCNLPLYLKFNLLKGLNKVKVVITDFKGHKIENQCKIYFIPSSEIVW